MEEPKRKVRVGMVGGGPGAGIAETHRIAMRLDDRYVLVAGVFSRDQAKSRQAAEKLGIPGDRVYADYQRMAEGEAKRKSDRLDAVCIVTRTDSHYEIAKKFLEAGINVICDKPLCLTLAQARELKALADRQRLVLCVTHNYSGYAMVRQAGRMVRDGMLGEIKVVQAEHASGWAAKMVEQDDNPRAKWRTDPVLLGDASLLLDLGTHAHQLARFVTGLEVAEVAAELSQIVKGRAVKDNAHMLLRFSNGACGTLWASMAAVGNEHGLRLRVYGEKGSLAWHHEDAHHLRYCPLDGSLQILAQGAPGLSADAAKWTRAGLGHPEGFFEAFANLYTEVADALLAHAEKKPYTKAELGFPDAADGARGVAFVEGVMRSAGQNGAWTKLADI